MISSLPNSILLLWTWTWVLRLLRRLRLHHHRLFKSPLWPNGSLRLPGFSFSSSSCRLANFIHGRSSHDACPPPFQETWIFIQQQWQHEWQRSKDKGEEEEQSQRRCGSRLIWILMTHFFILLFLLEGMPGNILRLRLPVWSEHFPVRSLSFLSVCIY